MTTATTIDKTPVTDSTLPDGDNLGNDILMDIGRAATANLKRTTGNVAFTPRGWTMGGRVD